MNKRSIYQVMFTVSRPGFKNIITVGMVLARNQAQAVLEATKIVSDVVDKMENKSYYKLQSAKKLTTDFFTMAEDVLSDSVRESLEKSREQ